MAILDVNYMSETLMRPVELKVILPIEQQKEKKLFSTLYLLHGVLGDCNDYIYNTQIVQWANKLGLAVVMINGDNKFYVNKDRKMEAYSTFLGEEVVAMTRKMFPLSTNREQTFIGGISMGGFGAMLNGFTYEHTFGYVIGISSAMIINRAIVSEYGAENYLKDRAYFEYCFGEITMLAFSDKNPAVVIRKKVSEKKELPKVFMACGSSDHLYKDNVAFYDFLAEEGIDVEFLVDEGTHDWEFWNRYLKVAMEWLPLEQETPVEE